MFNAKTRVGSRKIIASVLAMAMTVSLIPSFLSVDKVLADTAKNQDNTCLGTSGISAPVAPSGKGDPWTGDYVYFGTYDNNPIKFRVLSPSTTAYGGTTMFLDCDTTLFNSSFDNDSVVWADSELRAYLNGEFLTGGSFTTLEQSAIAASTADAHDLVVGSEAGQVSERSQIIYVKYVALDSDKIFLLDAEEASNINYGYSTYDEDWQVRVKSGSSNYWWLRTAYKMYSFGDFDGVGLVYFNGYLRDDSVENSSGVAPALNVDLSSVVFSTAVNEAGTEYKLTLKDDGLKIAVPEGQEVTASGTTITVPYEITGDDAANATRASVLILDKEYGASDAEILYYDALGGTFSNSAAATGTFTLPSSLDIADWGTEYYVYILAEDINGSYETDYAGTPVLLDTPQVAAQIITYYDLWVGDTQVTSANASNVLNETTADGDPTVVYDAATNTLTLNGATITGPAREEVTGFDADGGIIYAGDEDFTLNVIGGTSTVIGGDTKRRTSSGLFFGNPEDPDVDIKNYDITINIEDGATLDLYGGEPDTTYAYPGSYGLSTRSIGDMTITGSGTLNAIGGESKYSYGIKLYDTLIIDGPTVNASGADSCYSVGISSNGKITINSGTVSATAGYSTEAGAWSYGIMNTNNAITINGGTVTAKGFNSALRLPATLGDGVTAGGSTNMDGSGAVDYVANNNDSYKWFGTPYFVNYDLWVGGTQVTSANASNVLGDTGDPTVVYDADTNTLSLNGATITGPDSEVLGWNAGGGIVYSGTEDFTIKVTGGVSTVTGGNTNRDRSAGLLIADPRYVFSGSSNPCKTTIIIDEGATLTLIGGVPNTYDKCSVGLLCDTSGGLTITGSGTLNATGNVVNNASYGIYTQKKLTIDGPTVNASGADSFVSVGIYSQYGVNIKSGNVTATAGYYNDYRAWSYGFNVNNGIAINGGTVTAIGYKAALNTSAMLGDGVTASGSTNMDGSDAEPYAANNYDYKWFSSSFTPPVIVYDLWIGDTQVTSANASNVLNETAADGNPTVVYDADTNTLTLNGATITGPVRDSVSSNDADGGIIYAGSDDFTLNVIGGTSTVTGGDTKRCSSSGLFCGNPVNVWSGTPTYQVTVNIEDGAILNLIGGVPDTTYGYPGSYGLSSMSNAEVTITGSGTLNAIGGASMYSYGIDSNGDITIDGPTVNASGADSYFSTGIASGSDITINSGTVTATGGYSEEDEAKSYGFYGNYYYNKVIAINGGTVTATGYTSALNMPATLGNGVTAGGSTNIDGTGAVTYVAEDNGDYKWFGSPYTPVIITPGWNEIDGQLYYADQNCELLYNSWITEGNKTYYVGDDGAMVTGRQKIDGDFYYFKTDGRMATGWKVLGKSTYYFDPATGKAVTGWQTIDGSRYYFKSNWKMATGWKVTSGGTTYYLDTDGTMVTGLKEIEGKTYYFASNGKMKTGLITIGNYKYYFGDDGSMQTGKVTIDGNLYYFKTNGRMATGWKKLGNYNFYFDPSTGKAVTGWQTLDGYRYYFKSNGKMLTGWKVTSGGTSYYFGEDGKMVTGWQTIDGYDYYFDTNGKLLGGYS